MAAAAPLLAPVLSGGLGSLATAAAVGGSILGTFSDIQSTRFQASVLSRQAQQATENAEQEVFRGQLESRDRDFAAAEVLANEFAQQAGSGFDINSGSFVRRRNLQRRLVRRDSLRIRQQSEARADQFRTQAETAATEAAGLRSSIPGRLFSGVVGIGSDLITGAEQINASRARQIRRDSLEAS